MTTPVRNEGRLTFRSGKRHVFLRTFQDGSAEIALMRLIYLARWIKDRSLVRMREERIPGRICKVLGPTLGSWFPDVCVTGTLAGCKQVCDFRRDYDEMKPFVISMEMIAKWFCEGWFDTWHAVSTRTTQFEAAPDNATFVDWFSKTGELSACTALPEIYPGYSSLAFNAISSAADKATPPHRSKSLRVSVELVNKHEIFVRIPFTALVREELCEGIYKYLHPEYEFKPEVM